MFETVSTAPPDAILGLTEAFRGDPNPDKINLTVGVYQDEQGRTPILDCVKRAEEQILGSESTKTYVGIAGSPEYARAVQELLFAAGHEVLESRRAATLQTPGGTGALRVAADFLSSAFPGTAVWLSEPTWPNHPSVFRAAGLEVKTYTYFDRQTNTLNVDGMLESLRRVQEGDVVLLHGCCHNPTGVDPSAADWRQIADAVRQCRALPFLDFAYQGLADGIREDAIGLEALVRPGGELLVASSFSKNFGLYCERIGALTAVCPTAESQAAVLSQLKLSVRANYSNPPAHGAAVVTRILQDPQLRSQWEAEVAQIRERINAMRRLFADSMRKLGVGRDFSFVTRQRGMFSFLGLTTEQVLRLRDQFALYVVDSGRVNFAGMTRSNMDAICRAIASVL